MPFLISALLPSQFEHLFSLAAPDLRAHHAMRVTVTKKPGFPCRLTLADAEVGEEVILAHYRHQDVETPFRASHAVYVRPGFAPVALAADEVPEMLRSRVLSLRAFDAEGMLIAAELADGEALEAALAEMFRDGQTAYIHIHFGKPGCYAARADRVIGE